MADKWEVVSGPKKKPRTNVVGNGASKPVKINTVPGAGVPAKPKKPLVPTAKIPAAFPLLAESSDSDHDGRIQIFI